MKWLRETAALLMEYRQIDKDYRAAMRTIYRAHPEIPKRVLRREVKAEATK